ncbi:hypothetical protein CIHG_04179 [Coccidioides immitis H538.4]|uniref:Uncharacterized protein n=2 Tax=Coccidioides immitis TaxID=5501 RepID=A0A0J8RMS6_COCIT|nr:hypothetical protein CIRG_04570 [Coccidioides immitis RMSCC 2394]KMU86390.1 hypothetical protein CIHG_04179 [Coccidioides immitis H538.4]
MEINMWVFYFVSCHSSDARMFCIFRIHLYAFGSIIRPLTSLPTRHRRRTKIPTTWKHHEDKASRGSRPAPEMQSQVSIHPTPRPDLDTPPPGYYLILLIVIALSFRH